MDLVKIGSYSAEKRKNLV
ncbi:hypothetical protein RO1_21890 [Roseburia intestinalis XB6B4]|uniref:Uncharacterized protein n=1 Tax=Roseburia intestinalis XB6B4 TaxID=718255 RepID=D4KZB1_9FIRM|nr:hypothetical protein RO1_21890 [Roseburia intestinalis XB6B4]